MRCCKTVTCDSADEHWKNLLVQGSAHSGQCNEDIASFGAAEHEVKDMKE